MSPSVVLLLSIDISYPLTRLSMLVFRSPHYLLLILAKLKTTFRVVICLHRTLPAQPTLSILYANYGLIEEIQDTSIQPGNGPSTGTIDAEVLLMALCLITRRTFHMRLFMGGVNLAAQRASVGIPYYAIFHARGGFSAAKLRSVLSDRRQVLGEPFTVTRKESGKIHEAF